MGRRWTFALTALVVIVLLVVLAPGVSATPGSSVVHIVRPGETLYSIARYYGVDMWVIARSNNILNPNRIYVGQRLVIPTGGVAGFIHVVQPGETLTRIALRYGVSTWAIAQANGLYDLNYIWAGQRLLIPGLAPAPAPTATPYDGAGAWYGQYYNDPNLAGSAYATRYDGAIDFNWGWKAPMAGGGVDNFSVRWDGTLYFAGGLYRFYARVDDGVRVWVDEDLIVDQWKDGSLRVFSADRELAAGDHDIRVEYYDRIQVARIHFWWQEVEAPEATVTPDTTCAPTFTSAPAGAGWFGEFYNNTDLQGSPVATRYDPWIGFDWGTGSPTSEVYRDNFSARWTITAQLGVGAYNFCAMTDDGVRIWVDDVLVLDEWHASNKLAHCGKHRGEAGNYEVVVEYFEGGGDALIYVWWE